LPDFQAGHVRDPLLGIFFGAANHESYSTNQHQATNDWGNRNPIMLVGGGVNRADVQDFTPIRPSSQELNAAEKHENHDNSQHEADATRRKVAPVTAVRPTWNSAYKCQDQKHDQNSSEHCFSPFRMQPSKVKCPPQPSVDVEKSTPGPGRLRFRFMTLPRLRFIAALVTCRTWYAYCSNSGFQSV
jgi:hypothetical protein